MNGQDLYPLFLKLNERRCLIVGGGGVAYRKVLDLIDCGAEITLVAEKPNSECVEIASKGKIKLLTRSFRMEDMKGMFLVFAATNDSVVNAEIAALARQEGILANSVDDPEQCDFFSGAVVKRGPLRIAISTSGSSPFIAQKIRRELEKKYDQIFGSFIQLVGEIRKDILASDSPDENKTRSLNWLAGEDAFTLFKNSGKEIVWEEVKKILYSS